MRSASDGERRLLKRERRAERELAETLADLERERERLRRIQEKVDRRLAAVTEAEERLRSRQAARAAGPATEVAARPSGGMGNGEVDDTATTSETTDYPASLSTVTPSSIGKGRRSGSG